MYTRYQLLTDSQTDSVFLFGARQTGKSILLRSLFPEAIYIDLLETDTQHRFRMQPSLLRDVLNDYPNNSLVIIDEIQQVPELLNEVHLLISRKQMRFVLCGSSARKLKRQGVNTLGGRALPEQLYPLVSDEIPDFDLQRALTHGLLPKIYLSARPSRLLQAYVDVYLKEEIQAEALVRNLKSFTRFMEVAALTNGEIVNYNNIATDCGISAKTAAEYFTILQDTLIGYLVPAFTDKQKRRLVQAPKFWLFDVGVANHLLHRKELVQGTVEYGHAFEHFVVQELIAYLGYHHNEQRLTYWRTYTGSEVDAVITNHAGDPILAIEIKSAQEIMRKHLKGLHAFHEEYSDCPLLCVSLDKFNRVSEGIRLMHINDFLKQLWADQLF